MDYLAIEMRLCSVLKDAGWIDSFESDRQDTYITWTPLGTEKLGDVWHEIAFLGDFGDAEASSLLREFVRYHGIGERRSHVV